MTVPEFTDRLRRELQNSVRHVAASDGLYDRSEAAGIARWRRRRRRAQGLAGAGGVLAIALVFVVTRSLSPSTSHQELRTSPSGVVTTTPPAPTADRRPRSSTRIANRITTTLRMDSTVASSGTVLHANITVSNHTGAPIVTYGCRDAIVAVSLTGGKLSAAQNVPAGPCRKRFSMPVGETVFPVAVGTRYQPTLDPLPTGRYLAKVEFLTIELPVPAPIPVTLTKPAPDVNRNQPARCSLDQHKPNHVSEHTLTIGGVRYYKFTNPSPRPCLIVDAPVLQMLDAHGRPLRTVTDIPNGDTGSAPRQTITLRPGQSDYLTLSDLTRQGFGNHPPTQVCPTSASLVMTFPYSPGKLTITGLAGKYSPYVQIGKNHVNCGRITIIPLSPVASNFVGT